MSQVHPRAWQQPSSAASSQRPSADSVALSKKPSREPLRTLFEKQGIKPFDIYSTHFPIPIPVRRDSGASSRRQSIAGSLESSTPGTPVVRLPHDFCPMTPPPPPKTPARERPPIPDFDQPPYAKPVGRVFCGDQWDPLVDGLEDKVIKFLIACETLAKGLNLSAERLSAARTGLHHNVLALDEQTITEITRDCWWIMFEVIADGLRWRDILNTKRSLLERLKRNLRQSQPQARWDIPCDILISLGFMEPWLYE